MSELKVWLMALLCLFVLFVNFIELIKEIKEIRKIKVTRNDKEIKAVVIDSLPYITRDIRPILRYVVEGIEKKYIYHFYYNPKKYPIGKEMTLKLSEDSSLAYDRMDLAKAFIYQLFAAMLSAFLVWICIYYIIFFKH